jgi:hypothetical protein
VIGLLRFIGVMNAAVWLGGAVFFTFFAAPVFFKADLKRVLGEAQAGIVGMEVLWRYFLLTYVCGAIALLHQLAEWIYLGRVLQRLTLGLVLVAFGFGLVGGLALEPHMHKLHQKMYSYQQTKQGFFRDDSSSPAQRVQAARTFRVWHGISMGLNLGALIALGIFAWRVTKPADDLRFIPAGKFRS